MIQFFAPDIAETLVLPEDESIHCARVLRKDVGDTIFVVDGKGNRYSCVITVCKQKAVHVEIKGIEAIDSHWQGEITLAVAPTKNSDRIEWLVEKATEIGVDKIVLMNCDHSERRKLNTERIRRIAVAAMKQSLKAKLPEISELTQFDKFIESNNSFQKFIAYCGKECERVDFSKAFCPNHDVTIVIGPEGDFSPSEITKALASGFTGVTFGDCRLRTETAALYGITAVHVLNSLSKNN